jgi:hypothetical protein
MEDKDSKVSRQFLRMTAKELGIQIDPALKLNSWELFDLIIKDIHLLLLELKRAKTENKKLKQQVESQSQVHFHFDRLLQPLNKKENGTNGQQIL